MNKQQKSSSPQHIWRWPILINIIALLGIIVALVGHGWLDVLSWLCLGSCTAFVIYIYYFRKQVK